MKTEAPRPYVEFFQLPSEFDLDFLDDMRTETSLMQSHGLSIPFEG